MNSHTICGGESTITRTTCITFTSGQWVTSHELTERRGYHTSWSTEAGIVLMGGAYTPFTTEILTEGEYDGVPGFDMQYNTE